MTTLGLDLSTDPAKAWWCELDWPPGEAPRILELQCAAWYLGRTPSERAEPQLLAAVRGDEGGAESGSLHAADQRLAALLAARLHGRGARPAPSMAGIDAPFGWPTAFVEEIAAWHGSGGARFRKRRELRLRATDRVVADRTRHTPMSVSTDRIGSTAMLCVEALSRLAELRGSVALDRALGEDGVAEVYPAGALAVWTAGGASLPRRGYKMPGDREVRRAMLSALAGELDLRDAAGQPLLEALAADDPNDDGLPGTAPALVSAMLGSDDALDALLCGLIARAVAIGASEGPPEEARHEAAREGWIHLPSRADLRALLAPAVR